MVSAIHEFINPLALYVVHAPTWDFSATLLYYYPAAVLEWESRHFTILPPVDKLGSLIFHSPHPLRILSNGKKPYSLHGIKSNEAPSPGIDRSLT
jgi:hypothetical protein